MPPVTMHRTVMKRIQSVLSLCAILVFRRLRSLTVAAQLLHYLLKHFASVLIASELIETRAGGRQQDGIARVAVRERVPDRRFQRFGFDQRDTPLQRVRNLS